MKIKIKALLKEYNANNGTKLGYKDLVHLIEGNAAEKTKIETLSGFNGGHKEPSIITLFNLLLLLT